MSNRIKVICPSCKRPARRSRHIRPYGSADLCRTCYMREKQRAKYRSLKPRANDREARAS